MKPKPVTPESEREALKRHQCDQMITGVVTLMLRDVGAPMGMVLDRMTTYVAAQACANDGAGVTAHAFRELADRIEGGLFHRIATEHIDRAKGD